LKKFRLESYPFIYTSDVKFKGNEEREEQVAEHARVLDESTGLEATNSTIQCHSITLNSSPMSVYLHTNKKQYLNELLREH